VVLALLLFQLMMVGLFGVKRAPTQSMLCLPLPFITVGTRSSGTSACTGSSSLLSGGGGLRFGIAGVSD
jgi:hypothetical protein